MKKLLILATLGLSFQSFAQSYLILNNGVTLTTDKDSYVYDFGHFIAPYQVNLNGGQFLVQDEKLITIDEKGFLYRKDEKVKKVKGKGTNYFITDNNNLYTIDAAGFFYKFDKEAAVKKAANFGGNFFTVNADEKKKIVDLYTLNTKGNYFKTNVAGLNPADIATFGGSFFVTNKNVVYTVSKDGFVFSKAEVKVGAIKKAGGNYFVDAAGVIFTVTNEGFLMVPTLPASLKIASIAKLGLNYFIDTDGKLFVVDGAGAIIERTIDHDLRNTKVLSL